MPPAPAVTVTAEVLGDELLLHPEGELDLAGAGACAAELRDAVVARPRPGVVIDLAGVSFLGVAGIRVLLCFAEEAAGRGICTRFVLPARLKRITMRVGVAGELARFGRIDGTALTVGR